MKRLDVDNLREFMARKSAMLSPSGELFPVNTFVHADLLKEFPEFRDLVERFREHISNGIASELNLDQAIMQDSYKNGWAHLGLYGNDGRQKMEIMSVKETLDRQRSRARDIAELLGVPLKEHHLEFPEGDYEEFLLNDADFIPKPR